MTLFLEVLGYACLGLGGVGCIYYFALGLVPRVRREGGDKAPRIFVLVPAHNEANVIGNLLGDLKAQTVKAAGVLVVAHRCQDETEQVARAEGVEVLRLSVGEGKSAALKGGFEALHSREWDGVLVVDADCRIDSGFLARVRMKPSEVVQARVQLHADPSGGGRLYEFLYRLDSRFVHEGREELGLPAFLRGTGMLLGRGALERCPWRGGGLTEDREQGLLFLRAGVPVRHDPRLSVISAPPQRLRERWNQRRRWTSAGLLSQLVVSMKVARDAAKHFGRRTWELPLAVLADAKTQCLLLIAVGTVCLGLAGGPYWLGVLLLAGSASIVVACGFVWYGSDFLKTFLELPQIAAVALGSGILSMARRPPGGWHRGREQDRVSDT